MNTERLVDKNLKNFKIKYIPFFKKYFKIEIIRRNISFEKQKKILLLYLPSLPLKTHREKKTRISYII